MKGKSTKTALLMSFTSLLLCFAMLIGSTFAWFTDSVTSGVNKIQAGNLDIEVTHSNAHVSPAESIEGVTAMFTGADGNAILWEPGAMSYENFTVKNVGNLALKYNMAMNVVAFNSVTGTNDNLKDALKVKVLTGTNNIPSPVTREKVAALDWNDAQTLEQFKKDGGKLYPVGTDGQASEEAFQVIVYWQPTDNDNRWNLNNGKHNTDGYKIGDEEALYINFGVTVVATQLEYESDSFDNLYDKTAEAPSIVMPTWSGESEEVALPAEGVAATMEVKVNNQVRATATVEAGTKINGAVLAENEKLKLTIEPDDAPNGITVDTGNSVTTFDVSLVKVVTTTETEGGEETKTDVKVTEADKPVLVSLDIGIVDLVDFYHHGEKLTKVENKENVDVDKYFYKIANGTGTVYFKTNSFSPFASVYKFAGGLGNADHPYLIANGEQWYSLIEDHHQGYIDGLYVKLIGDLDMENYDLNDYVTYPKNFSLDGNGHKFTNLNSTIWGYYGYYYGTCEIKDLTVENSYAKYSLFGYGPGTPYADQTVNVSNVTVKNCETNGGTFMYYTGAGHINFNTCVVENSLVHGPSNMGGGGFVGNGQGITIDKCKFGGSVVAESTNMVAGFVGQGVATIKNSEITSGTVIRSIAAGGNVAAYDGQGGGAGAADNNVFNGTLCCDTEAKAKKQNSGAAWVKYEGLKQTDFQLAEDGTITFVGENRNFSSATISESIFQRSDYYKNGNSGQSGAGAYLLGGYSCYWEDLIHVDSITSNTLYKVDRVKNIVNVVSEGYADKIACATAVVPNVAWTRYHSYLDRETGTLYYDGRCSTDDKCGFIGDSATVTANGTMTPKTNPKGDFNIVIKCFDENGGLVGSVTLKYSVNFASDPT